MCNKCHLNLNVSTDSPLFVSNVGRKLDKTDDLRVVVTDEGCTVGSLDELSVSLLKYKGPAIPSHSTFPDFVSFS